MRNKAEPVSHKKKHPISHGECIKKFRIYPYFLYSHLDKWLKSMSEKGWHIVHCGMFFFWFEKGSPQKKEYFTYTSLTQEGRYSIALRYPFLEKTYGLPKNKSKINSNGTKKHQIVEIDDNKIDIENDVGYKELINDRNRLYVRYFIIRLGVMLGVVSIIIVLELLNY